MTENNNQEELIKNAAAVGLTLLMERRLYNE